IRTASNSLVRIRTTVKNESDKATTFILKTRLVTPRGDTLSETKTGTLTLAAGDSADVEQSQTVDKPEGWKTTSPSLYTAVTDIQTGGETVDRVKTKFGIRTITFDAKRGFLLNGEPVKLKGGCFHDDHGPLGAKSYDRAEERRVQILIKSGYNAIRCS